MAKIHYRRRTAYQWHASDMIRGTNPDFDKLNASSRTQPIAMAIRKSAQPHISTTSLGMWHKRMGHIQTAAIKKAEEMVDGVKISDPEGGSGGDQESLCSTCNLSSAPKQISRQPIGNTFGRYGQILDKASNSDQYAVHFYSWVFDYTTFTPILRRVGCASLS